MSIVRFLFFCKQKTAYDMRMSDWSSDVCSPDLPVLDAHAVFKSGDDRGESARVGIQRGHGKPHTASTCYGMSGRPGRAPGERPDCPVNREIGRASCRERVCQYV